MTQNRFFPFSRDRKIRKKPKTEKKIRWIPRYDKKEILQYENEKRPE